MKHIRKTLLAVLLTGVLSLALLTACGSSSEGGGTTAPVPGADDAVPETLHPIDLSVQAQPTFDFPLQGMTIALPQDLQTAINTEKSLYMDAYEAVTEDGSAIRYAFVSWKSVTEEQKSAEIDYDPAPFQQWVSSLTQAGSVGMFARDQADQLDAITGSDVHQLLGESSDGAYQYYLSTNSAAPEEARQLISGVTAELRDRAEFTPGDSAFGPGRQAAGNLGSFSTQDIHGTAYTQELFAENKLTLVNLYATWCSPCVREIPELEELSKTLAAQDVGVIGVVLDAVGPDGQPDQTAIETARKLAERTGATYPFLVPDATAMNGRLLGVTAVPETFFVDSQGNIVGDTYPGARDLKGWTEIVELELSRLEAAE